MTLLASKTLSNGHGLLQRQGQIRQERCYHSKKQAVEGRPYQITNLPMPRLQRMAPN